MNHRVLDETRLHAYLDGQLSHAECESLLKELEVDPKLRNTLNEMRQLKELVQHAYNDIEPPARPLVEQDTPRRRIASFGVAALLLLSLGFTGGWLSKTLPGNSEGGMQLAAVEAHPRVVLHIASAEDNKFQETLDRAELLLTQYRSQGAQIEVVANSEGIDLLRTNTSPFVERIRSMMTEYDELSFIACHNAVARLEREGIKVVLIPSTKEAPSVVEHIIERVRDGWTYIKV